MPLLTYYSVTKEHKPAIESSLLESELTRERKKERDEPEVQSNSGKVKSGKIRTG